MKESLQHYGGPVWRHLSGSKRWMQRKPSMQSAPWLLKWWHPTACAVPTVLAVIKIPVVSVVVIPNATMISIRAFSITNI